MNTGIRLPWVEARETAAGGGADNFAPLASLDWQVQVYGAPPSAAIEGTSRRRGLALHHFAPAAGSARRAGLLEGPPTWSAPTVT